VTRSSPVSNWSALAGADPLAGELLAAELTASERLPSSLASELGASEACADAVDEAQAAGARVARVERIFHRHLHAVWRTARDLGVLPRDQEDVVQEVMLVCVRRLHDIEPPRERAFLLAATAKVVANWRRGRRRRPAEPVEDVDRLDSIEPANAPSDPAQALEHKRELQLVQAALEQMTEQQRVAFTLFEIEGLSAREIADQLGLSETVVFARVQRARGVFQRLIGKVDAAGSGRTPGGRHG
jgi:RNA polymerase sigma-70 factor (ECF subfamily)